MDFLCSNLVKTIFTYWIGTVFNLILQLASEKNKISEKKYVKVIILYLNNYSEEKY